ncbi:MAG TPA: hypothetical protein V6D14_17950 [Coleofasciculaceae cyanobacterium]|jgi:myosin heavy subunit
MSDADTPNNQPLPELPASTDDSSADPLDATDISDNPQIVKSSELPDVKDPIQPWRPDLTIESETATKAWSAITEGDDRTTETADVSERRTKDADWFALAQKMRQRNRRLLDQVNQLRAALKEKQEELHSQQTRSQQQEVLLAQQAEELSTVQDQLTRMFQALESSHQAAQRQQILIETLSEQLQSSQERVAQLERECALTQQRYNEQSHQLLQAANTCRELRTRLHRQQQQTMQFKVALEKSLEMPTSSTPTQQLSYRSSSTTSPVFPKTQPIQPWSAQPEVLKEKSNFDTIWKLPILLDPLQAVYPSDTEPLEIRRLREPDRLTVGTSKSAEIAIASSQESTDTELELEQQLLAEMTSLAEAAGLSEFQSDLADTRGQLLPESEIDLHSNEALPDLSEAQETSSAENIREVDRVQLPSEDLWVDSATREQAEPDVILPQSNWPSPTLYPLRSPKKRKSLAAIELPSFPRYNPT